MTARRPPRPRRRPTSIVAAVVATLAIVTVAPPVARAAPTGTIALRAIPAWSAMGDDLNIRVNVRGTTAPGLQVRAVIHRAVLSRLALERTFTGRRLGSFLTSTEANLDTLATVGTDRVFTIPLQNPDLPRDPARILLTIPGSGQAGVFPVEIQLRDPANETVLDTFVTQLVVFRPTEPGEQSAERLRVAWMWPVTGPPSLRPSGSASPAFLTQLDAGGRLDRIGAGIEAGGDLPLTLVPTPDTVDGLRAASENPQASRLLDTLRSASRRSSVVSSSYTTIDAPAMLRGDLDLALDTQWTVGRRTLETGLGSAVDPTISAPQPLDAPTLNRLRDVAGTTRVVVDATALEEAPPADQFTMAAPFRLELPESSFDAVVVNAAATATLVAPGSAPLRAQQLLALLAVIGLEQPATVRGIVLGPPLNWSPSADRLRTVLNGLRDHPLLTTVPVATIFDVPAATVDGRPYTRTLAPLAASRAPIGGAEYLLSRQRIDSLASMIGEGDPLVGMLRHQLRLTPSERTAETGRLVSLRRVSTINAAVSTLAADVTAPGSRTITLTSRKASIPISIENASDRTMRVRVALDSQKLVFPDGDSQLVDLAPGNTTTVFNVETRISGTFPVTISVTAPDGGLELQAARYTVRSSAVSGVGLILTIGAALFLGLWWITHWRRNRQPSTAVS